MGKTAKPLSILVTDDRLYGLPEVQALHQKGHTLISMPGCTSADILTAPYDVIIGPQCWRVDPALGNLEAILEMVLKGVRAMKRGKK